MKKLIIFFLAFSLLSCNDGDFDVPVFQFTDTVNSCGEYILHIKNSNSTEVLVLTLSTTEIAGVVGEEQFNISSSLEATYRIFEEGISSNYFCQNIPPSTPKVIKELNAESGIITVITNEIITNDVITGYSYTITLSELLFNENSERIFFENLDFGIFTMNL